MPPGAERSPRQLWRLAILVALATIAALFVRVTGPDHRIATGAAPVQAAAGPTVRPSFTVAVTGEILPHPSADLAAQQAITYLRTLVPVAVG